MNTEIRRKDRAITDQAEIDTIIQNAKVLHLGLMDGDYPYVVPLHYGFEYQKEQDTFVFYMHGAKVGHKIDLIKECANACVELETGVALTSDGSLPCRYGSYYSSVMGIGTASIVEGLEEKKHALELLMANQTGRAFVFTEQMVSSVAVIKVEVHEYTAKARKEK